MCWHVPIDLRAEVQRAVGVSPMEYLTRWRMLLAGDRIANTSDSILEIVQSLAYESASAFTKAFKKNGLFATPL